MLCALPRPARSQQRSALAWALSLAATFPVSGTCAAQIVPATRAARAAIHPIETRDAMAMWLRRVPETRAFPPDFADTLKSEAPLLIIEMTTAPGCIACADLWAQLAILRSRYGWRTQTISGDEALLRSGRLGLPWIGHPVAWVRARDDQTRMVPIAIGTDHAINLARNLYLAAKMLTGVRPAVAVRAMSKFTGIVSVSHLRPSGR